ncbi:MAG: caspase family protein [Prevotella sp.]|nr:caspase family protein [Prevotella sp.]
MKKILLIYIMSIFVITSNAQTIHWLTFIDTEDSNVGKIDITGRNVLYSRFVNVINAALLDKGYKSDIHDIYDSALSPERCKSEVLSLKCEENDIVIFYYIGHGTHAQAENNPYPQMLLGCDFNEENKFIPLKWVHDQLKTKGAKLAVTIGMCCNVIQTASAKKAPTFSVNYGNIELSDTERNAIQKMFLGYKGDFILSSASVGQSSCGGPTPLGDMDLFTAVLVTIFGDMAYDGNLSWDSLFSEVKSIVNNATNGKQTPFWSSNLSTSSLPSKQPVQTPVQKPVVNTPVQNNNPSVE